VDGFWSVTVYNAAGFYEAPETAISVNNVTAEKDADGQVTIHFGGDPAASNYLRIMPGWNYTVRLYRPRPALLDGPGRSPTRRRQADIYVALESARSRRSPCRLWPTLRTHPGHPFPAIDLNGFSPEEPASIRDSPVGHCLGQL
jgi:hypothetical protein